MSKCLKVTHKPNKSLDKMFYPSTLTNTFLQQLGRPGSNSELSGSAGGGHILPGESGLLEEAHMALEVG